MCGIVGYIGERPARPILLNCLARLEYRGYDSCGIAVAGDGLQVHKDVVRVAALKGQLPRRLEGKTGIGHTRWATHGAPSKINAHPHGDCTGKIAVVHNGIIHNFQSLRQQLIKEGHKFASETDTEVIPHLVEKYFDGDLEKAVAKALHDMEGSYAIAVLMDGQPGLVADEPARHGARKYGAAALRHGLLGRRHNLRSAVCRVPRKRDKRDGE